MRSPLQVGLEATAACRPVRTGIARYAYNLMANLVALGHPEGETYTAFARASRLWKRGCRPTPVAGLKWKWYEDSLPLFARSIQVMHGLEMRVPARFRGPRVATVHDLFGLVSDDLLNSGARKRNAQRYQEVADSCDQVIAVSEQTKRDFLRFYDFPPERIHVVHLGVDPAFRPRSNEEVEQLRSRHRLHSPFLLYVGDLTPRKNLLCLLQAFELCEVSRDLELVIVGAREDGAGDLDEALRKSTRRDQVRTMGWIEEEDLQLLYSAAEALVFPSLYEGFGLPILEALASRTPALGSMAGALPEVAAGHATLVDPKDPDAIAEGIVQVLRTTPRMIEAAEQHARGFSWQSCAERTRTIYRHAVEVYQG